MLIDAGCVWDARHRLRRAHAFADFKIEWLEEPLRPEDYEGYAWLAIARRFPSRPVKKSAAARRSAR